MKVTTAASNIVGVQVGEVALNFLMMGPPIKAKFALITEEGDAAGFVDVSTGWSEKVLEALRVFSEVLEEEALQRIFEGTQPAESPPTPEERIEPPQF